MEKVELVNDIEPDMRLRQMVHFILGYRKPDKNSIDSISGDLGSIHVSMSKNKSNVKSELVIMVVYSKKDWKNILDQDLVQNNRWGRAYIMPKNN